MGRVLDVSTEAQPQEALTSLHSNTTIRLASDTYRLTQTLYLSGTLSNVTLRGAIDDRDDVVILESGTANSRSDGTPYGIWAGGDVRNLTITRMVSEYERADNGRGVSACVA